LTGEVAKNMYSKEFMELATKQALRNVQTKEGGPFGTVIVKDGKIIAQGRNHVLADNDPTAHGEIYTIRKACHKLNTFDLSGCELYTNAEPCPMCLSAIIWSNIKTVYYGNTAKDAGKIGFRDDAIYKWLDKPNKNMLNLIQRDRGMTINSFRKYADSEHTLY
jgi:guanine deaminase